MLHWLPENISTYGAGVDYLIANIYHIVGAWFILSELVLLFFLIRYRRRAGVKPVYLSGATFKSMLWILIPAVLVLGFDLSIDHAQSGVWREIKQTLPKQAMPIRVKGRQFMWEMIYPGPDGRFDTVDDISSLNALVVPVHTSVQIELEAEDVIHSLWMPNLRFKQDAVPGRKIQTWFQATQLGVYPIACAELCGVGHGIMQAQLHVLSPEAFAQFLKKGTLDEAL